MRKLYRLVACLAVLSLVLAGLGACAASTPTATIKPTPSPTSKPTAPPTLSPSPTSKPTSSPTSAPVSFAGKTITMVVGSAAGSGQDMSGRLYAKYLPAYLPGKPTMMVRNMPGGAYTIGTNYAYSAKPDGLITLVSSSGAMLTQLLGSKAVHYDFLKMPALIGYASGSVFYAKSAIVGKLEDLPKAKGIVLGTSQGSTSYYMVCAKELLNIPAEKMAFAYSGGGDVRRAFLAGEINIAIDAAAPYLTSTNEFVKKGEVTPLFQTGLVGEKGNLIKDPSLPPEIPTIQEIYEKFYGKSPSGIVWRAYKSLIVVTRNYQDCFMLSPGTPDSIVRVYRDSCEAMAKNPEFLKSAESILGISVRWMVGEALDKGFRLNLTMDPEIGDWLRTMILKYGMVLD